MSYINEGLKAARIAANATHDNIVAAGHKAFLHTITVNKVGASSNIITIYNGASASGNIVAVIDTVNAGTLGTRIYDCELSDGLSAVMGTGTAGDVTITFKQLT